MANKRIRWKYRASVNHYEGTITGDIEPLLFICGRLCVTDLRESRASKKYMSPKHYKIVGLDLKQAKQLALDLVRGDNIEIHEANRKAWEEEQEKTVRIIEEAEAFIKKLKADDKKKTKKSDN